MKREALLATRAICEEDVIHHSVHSYLRGKGVGDIDDTGSSATQYVFKWKGQLSATPLDFLDKMVCTVVGGSPKVSPHIEGSSLRKKIRFNEVILASGSGGGKNAASLSAKSLYSMEDIPTASPVLIMCYNRGMKTSLADACCLVHDFPAAMVPGGGSRADFLLEGSVMMTLVSASTETTLIVPANQLASKTVTSSETQLPDQAAVVWRHALENTMAQAVDSFPQVRSALASLPARTVKSLTTTLNVMSADLSSFIVLQCSLVDLWKKDYGTVRRNLEVATASCQAWISMTSALCTSSWKDRWDGEPYTDQNITALSRRLEEILAVRSLVEEITKLLSRQDQLENKVDLLTVPFQSLDSLNYSKSTKVSWDRSVQEFEARVDSLSGILSQALASQGSEWTRYPHVVRRKVVMSNLTSVIENWLLGMTKKMSELSGRKPDPSAAPIENVKLAREVRSRLNTHLFVPDWILESAPKFKQYKDTHTMLLESFEAIEKDYFAKWATNVAAAKSDTVAFQISYDSTTRFFTLNVSDLIAVVMSDVRQVSAYGLQLPEDVRRTVVQASSLHKISITLQQLISLHNSIQAQVLGCTAKLLSEQNLRILQIFNLTSAASTFKLLWNQTSEGDILCSRLASAVEALNVENRRLRKVHHEIGVTLSSLIEVDLLRNQDKWKALLKEMRQKFDHIEKSGGRTSQDMYDFRRHWDYQLYKVMEHQYQIGLESLNDLIPERNIEIVVKNGQVAFSPSFETLREQYYSSMKDFVSIPFSMKGFGGSEFFRLMPDNNSKGVTTVYTKANELFSKLNRVRKKFREYIVLGMCGIGGVPDMETFAEELLTNESTWTMNYKSIKQRLKDISNIEDSIRLECFVISTAPIKAAIEDHLGRLAEVLNATLRKSAVTHLQAIDKFLEDATETLRVTPTTLEEVGVANKKFSEVKEGMAGMQEQFTQFHSKNKLLKSVSGVQIDYYATQQKWDKFVESQATFDKVISSQLDKMRDAVEATIQKYTKELQKFQTHWRANKPKNLTSLTTRGDIKSAIGQMQEKESEFEELKQRGKELREQCGYFGLPEPVNALGLLADVERETQETRDMWNTYETFDAEVDVLRAEDWLSFRSKTTKFEDLVKAWMMKLQTMEPNDVVKVLTTTIMEWAKMVPMLKVVRGDGMTPDHWSEMFRILEIEKGMSSDKLTFGHFLDRHATLVQKEPELRALHARAQGEVQIRDALQEIRTWAHATEFKLVPHPDPAKKMVLITEWKELLTALGDNQLLLGSLKDSQYFVGFADEANGWEQKLVLVEEYLQALCAIQRTWLHLEPIFSRGALPQEQPRFKRVDREYVSIMRDIESDARVMNLAQHLDYRERFKVISEQLTRCQKALNEFLEQKRERFPRFYFVSDDDLLEILGQSSNPNVIQAHLKKLFMGINTVTIAGVDKEKSITHMISAEGETVQLKKPVALQGEVEDWLTTLDDVMKKSLKTLLLECVQTTDLALHCSQILCLAESIQFTRMCETAIPKGDYMSLKALVQKKLRENTKAQAQADHVMSLKLKALILDGIHFIDVVDQLMNSKASKLSEWAWRRQLRFYAGGEEATLTMVDAQFKYGYEYQGNQAKLVHTPLTDRCYLTLTQGMALGYGGNPYGPAGTGKTESVKALGNLMGRQTLVFNCDEGIDFKAMGRIFVGLVKCGSWGCFDEFNRLKVDQLSAISQMIQVIQEALKNGEESCELLGKSVKINNTAGIFVTLNPAGKGYGGRSKLPDNLKQLFRAVAMTVPDLELIAETILYSEGFTCGKELSKKLICIFKLCKQTLTPQQHYDWGLRSLKAVLRMGGVLIEQNKDTTLDLAKESEIIIKAMRVNTLSKLTHNDCNIFNAIVQDVFPGINVGDIDHSELKAAITKAYSELKLQVLENQIQKILQLYEALRQRMGVVLVGPSGSGKSTLLRILRKALNIMGTEVPLYTINPKAINRQQLLGYMDLDTREWHEGVLTSAAKKVVKEPPQVQSWIFCDGDIDPEWVEALNSVLDDNKLLTMPNGVRVQFGSNVNFVFETHSLEYASPATVSRMGMIFLSEEDVDIKSTVATWLQQQPECTRALSELFDKFFYQAVQTLTQEKLVLETTQMGIVMSGLCQLQGISNKTEFALGLIRGLGSFLLHAQRTKFATTMFELCGEACPTPDKPLDVFYNVSSKRMSTYSYIQNNKHTAEDLATNPAVLTVDLQRNLDIVKGCIECSHPRPFVLVGPEGAGKSLLLRHCFSQLKSTKVTILNCNAQTSAAHVIQKLNSTCQVFSTNQGRVLRPRDAERLLLYLKDVNLPRPDRYGTVQLHSFLQQLILYHGFYDADLEWIGVEKVHIVASMNSQGTSGRYPVAPRFAAIVSIISVSYPDQASLKNIFTEYFSAVVNSPLISRSGTWNTKVNEIATMMSNVYDNVKKRFTVDDAPHYVFNPRDVTAWIRNLLNYDVSENDPWDALVYEACRIFSDRLVKADHRSKFEKILFDQLAGAGYTRRNDSEITRVYVSWAHPKKLLAPMAINDFTTELSSSVLSYCREFRDLEIYPSQEMLMWVAWVDRVLMQPCGNMVFVGRAGVGSRSILSVACHRHKIELRELNMCMDYGVKQFKTDLKYVLQVAGVEGRPIALLLEDHNRVDGVFLEMLNSLISNGEVPGLYANEELDQILNALKEETAQDMAGAEAGPYSLYINRVMKNLHVCLIMDPTNASFELQCQSNPALYTRCAFMWLGSWSTQTLQLIPKSVFQDMEPSMIQDVLTLQHSLPESKVTPQQFINMLYATKRLHTKESQEVTDTITRLQTGVNKIQEASRSVDDIKKDVTQKKKDMEEKQREADEALSKIQANMEDATTKRIQSEALQKRLTEEQEYCQKAQVDIENELAGIRPILEAAREAVGNIKSENLNEIRSLHMPPEAIRDVLEGVLMLLGIYDTSWVSMKKFLGQRGVKETILTFNASSITHESRDNVKKIVEQKASSFKHENIVRASVAAAPLAAWVKANVEYSVVLERTNPLEQRKKQLEDNVAQGKAELSKISEVLATIDKTVEELKKNLRKKTQEAGRLKDKLDKAQSTLEAAQELLTKLSSEQARWSEKLASLGDSSKLIPRRCVLAGAFIAYLGKEQEELRQQYLGSWKDKFKTGDFSFRTFLRTEAELLEYKGEGLPGDDLSLDNAVLIQEAPQTPLIIDPAHQALHWLTSHLKKKKAVVDICTSSDERLAHTLELGIRFGKTVIICEVDKVDPILYPIMRKDLVSLGPKKVVQVGDKTVDWQDSFRLYLVTRNSFITLPPDAANLVTVVNFSITRGGLEGQLLGTAIVHEQPELETQKMTLLKEEEALKMELAKLEEKLLVDLSQAQGSLLENRTLVDSLNTIKTQANIIADSLKQSRTLQAEMDSKREVFRKFAHIGSKLFFLTRDLNVLNNMYQFSLGSFLTQFNKALGIHKTEQCTVTEKIEKLCDTLINLSFLNVSRGLQKADRAVYGLHVVKGLLGDELCTAMEWSVFLGRADIGSSTAPVPTWVPPDCVPGYRMIQTSLPALTSQLQLDSADSKWKAWIESPTPESGLPQELSPFQQLLMLKVFRTDRMLATLNTFVKKSLKVPTLSTTLTFEQLVKEAHPKDPILLVMSPGADPTMEIQNLAFARMGKAKFHQVAMGGGQTDAATALLKRCSSDGSWLFLKNLHLVIAWLGVLEKEMNTLNAHDDFRLWLTTEAHEDFPPILLTMSIKVTLEAPPGIKQNLQRTYNIVNKDSFEKLSPTQGGVTFTLTYLHGILQERRTYIPQGFTKFYEFTPADWRAAADIISAQCSGSAQVDWVTVQGLLVHAIYGGRMDNDSDFKILDVYVQSLFTNATHGMGSAQTSLLGGSLKVPMTSKVEDHLKIVESLPGVDTPASFNMPANADRVVQRSKVISLVSSLAVLHTGTEINQLSREEWAAKVAPITQMWQTMSTQVNMNTKPPKANTTGPLEIFVVMEFRTISSVLNHVFGVMTELQKVLEGTSLLSSSVKALSNEMITGATPSSWMDKVNGSNNLQAWLRGLISKYDVALSHVNSLTSGGVQALIGLKWRLGDLMRPHAFLSALQQHTARQSNQPLVSLVLGSVWGENKTLPNCATSIKIDGLYIQGAKMSSDGSLTDVDVDAGNVAPTVPCSIGWVPEAARSKGMPVPVYSDSTREQTVMELIVPSPGSEGEKAWILKGVAILVDFFE
eukprot:PhF_6_TR38629/c0_g1_i1/m.57632/K10414/DYNC2H, DNCH2; dynein heavy chain 2, cytosolic